MKAVAELLENNAKAISKGLFRYAVQPDMVIRMIATLSDISDTVELFKDKKQYSLIFNRGKFKALIGR